MSGVLKEIFTDIILSKFYPDGSWLGELTSMDHMVDNNKINLAQVGANPEVIKDCTQFPITPTTRTDTGVEITLATFDTRPTHVSNVEEMETNYNKAESVLKQHIDTLRETCSLSAAYNIAPDSNSAAAFQARLPSSAGRSPRPGSSETDSSASRPSGRLIYPNDVTVPVLGFFQSLDTD